MQGLENWNTVKHDSAGIFVTTGKILAFQICRPYCGPVFQNWNRRVRLVLGHTCWATHGKLRATPILIALRQDVLSWCTTESLKTIWDHQRRIPSGRHFKGQTDTEIAVHLIGKFVEEDGLSVLEALKSPSYYPWTLRLCLGWFRGFRGHLRCKNKSPLLNGLGEGYNMVCFRCHGHDSGNQSIYGNPWPCWLLLVKTKKVWLWR